MYSIPFRNKSTGKTEINTLLAIDDPEKVTIDEFGPREDFVKIEKQKLKDTHVNAKILNC